MKKFVELEKRGGVSSPIKLFVVVYEWRGLDKVEIARKEVQFIGEKIKMIDETKKSQKGI